MRRIIITVSVSLALAFSLGSRAKAASPSKCRALKYKFAAKAAAAEASCKAKAAKAGTDVDPACLAKAAGKFQALWPRAEAKGDCSRTDNLTETEAAIDTFIDELTAALDVTSLCCQSGGSCWMGEPFQDAAACVQFAGPSGEAGDPGTVCNGATGACEAPPAATGQCCYLPQFSVCNGGSTIDLAGCVQAGGLDFPFNAICQPNGSCATSP